jgi:hypothetical protein
MGGNWVTRKHIIALCQGSEIQKGENKASNIWKILKIK